MKKKRRRNRKGYRFCYRCNIEYIISIDNFHRDASKKAGFASVCRNCRNIINTQYNAPKMKKDLSKVMEYRSIRQKYNREEIGDSINVTKTYINSDKRKGLISDIDREFVIEARKNPCVYCGYPSTGLDRLNNRIGHTKVNCVPCCKECNVGRNDNFTHEEMKIIGQTIKLVKDARKSTSDTVIIPLNY